MNTETSKIQNLTDREAIEKLKELVKHQPSSLFSTRLSEIPQVTRPMSVQEVTDDGAFIFLSARSSDKNRDISQDPRVQLYFINTSNYEFLTIFGYAEILDDKGTIDRYWSDIAKAWFPEGKNDPEVTVLKVTPESGFYWDTKDGKILSLIKIAASAVTGKSYLEGVEGNISVKH